ncbi:hypothetical protein OPKNFCMD_0416 [Methylobacterium crusticola]|uniref:Uncharacterized protein n=1 Tax=Methylobacterium crusticola TaxID=1697972 RepID=A0ABQ4QSP7_9HYPH|nr:hypothetical protein [Methylobacterium crusticola]GJD47706.1 hypothetical protein OPKNFCMD_0416 [Methylobacterium crusticola]
MILLATLWPAVLAALLVGLGAGLWAGWPAGPARRAAGGLLALGLGLAGLALAGVVPGRAGLWLESAALLLAAYLGGCALAALASRLRRPAPLRGP